VSSFSPFEHNHADPWAKAPIDLPTLNAKASDAVVSAITDVRETARAQGALRSSSLLLLGSAGAGKTHLFARLRRKLGPRAVFVLLRPIVGSEMTPRYVLSEIVKALGFESATDGVPFRQLDALVGASLAQLHGEPPHMPRAYLDQCTALDSGKREALLDEALEELIGQHPEIDETYLARLLRTPFLPGPSQRASLAWLGGRELEEAQVARLGVAGSLGDERVAQALQTLGVFAAPGAPIVLVFDQLENLMDPEGTGHRVRAYANLVAELFDTMRGFVIVQMALDTEWTTTIEPSLGQAHKTRLAARTELVSLPRPDEVRELVRLWSEQIVGRPEAFPWPFGDRRVRAWCETPGMTPRMLMIACRQALVEGPELEGSDAAPITAREPEQDGKESRHEALLSAWKSHIAKARSTLDEAGADRRPADPARLVAGLVGALRMVPSLTVTKVDVRNAVQVELRSIGRSVAVCIVHQVQGKSAFSALEKAASTMSKERALVVVRERAHEFPPTWKQSIVRQGELVRNGALWLSLEREDAARLLALETFMSAARSRDIEDASGQPIPEPEVIAWLGESLEIDTWAPLRILAAASLPAIPGTTTEGSPDVPPQAVPEPTGKKRTTKTAAEGKREPPQTAPVVRACLAQLRVCSLERLVREVTRVRPGTTRNDVVSALEELGSEVKWYGRSILAIPQAPTSLAEVTS